MLLILMFLPLLLWSNLIASIVCFIVFLVFAAKKRKKRGVGIAAAICFGVFLIILGILIALIVHLSSSAKSTRMAQAPVVMDQQEIQIRILGYSTDFENDTIDMVIENNSSQDILIEAQDIRINGLPADGLLSASVKAGRQEEASICLISRYLRTRGIESIDKLELRFHILELETWETVLDSEPVCVQFEGANLVRNNSPS